MARQLSDWISSYLAYTDDTESARVFNKWVAVSTVSSALRKKTWMQVGRLKVFPNLYIVLVAEPGVARKSQAISYATELINEIPDIIVGADSSTSHGLMETLADASTFTVDDQRVIKHSSLSIISREFESFLGNIGKAKMLTTLTDLFDAGENPWKHKTQGGGLVVIPSVFLNILGATTPESLYSCLSSLVFGGGLSSRMLFVFSRDKAKKVAIPTWSKELEQLKGKLVNDLLEISGMVGNFKMTEDAEKYWIDWYNKYEWAGNTRIEKAMEFDGWYSRKPMMIQKLSIVLSASESDNYAIEVKHFKTAEKMIEEVEQHMGCILSGYRPRVDDDEKSYAILKHVRSKLKISEKHLMQLLWRDMSEEEFDKGMANLIRRGQVRRVFESPEGKREIWYHYLLEGGNDADRLSDET